MVLELLPQCLLTHTVESIQYKHKGILTVTTSKSNIYKLLHKGPNFHSTLITRIVWKIKIYFCGKTSAFFGSKPISYFLNIFLFLLFSPPLPLFCPSIMDRPWTVISLTLENKKNAKRSEEKKEKVDVSLMDFLILGLTGLTCYETIC